MHEADLQKIYTAQIREATRRLVSAEEFLSEYSERKDLPRLDGAILQVRKALEAVAMASIAPDKDCYEALRASAVDDPDFRKDYHASRIFAALERVNPDFYPLPLVPATRKADGTWHFDRKETGFLTQKRFMRAYDRLGKHLHADNPWGADKNIQNLVADLPKIIEDTNSLLELHARFIRTPDFTGVWIVSARGASPFVINGAADGDFVVKPTESQASPKVASSKKVRTKVKLKKN